MHIPIRRAAFGAFALLLTLPGCTTNHSTNAILKKRQDGPLAEPTFAMPAPRATPHVPYAKNAVFVPRKSIFSLQLDAINPAWIHQEVDRALPGVDFSKANLKNDAASYLEGKDLWILITAKTTSASDPLEFEAKKIFKASVVKYNMRSFGIIPLDTEEARPISLESNFSYDIDLTVYEVKGVFAKRLAAGFYKSNPGLTGVAMEAWDALGGTFRSLVGDPLAHAFIKETGSDMLLERALLEAGAVLQFRAQFSILRLPDKESSALDKEINVTQYLLEDPVKKNYDATGPTPKGFSDFETYLKSLDAVSGEVKLNDLGRDDAFVLFTIKDTIAPAERIREYINSKAANTSPIPPGTDDILRGTRF